MNRDEGMAAELAHLEQNDLDDGHWGHRRARHRQSLPLHDAQIRRGPGATQ